MSRVLLARGGAFAPIADSGGPLFVALAGEDVAVHRLVLAETGARARRDELAMKLADLAAGDPSLLHVATSQPDDDGALWVALMEPERMEAAIAAIAAEGLDPQAVVPAALLLPEPEPGAVATASADSLVLVRSGAVAAAVEPELAPHLAAGLSLPAPRPLAELLRARPPADVPLDLRQGRFAPPVRWWASRGWQATAGLLAILLLLLALAPLGVERLRSQRIEAAYDEATRAMAARALGKTFPSAEAAAAALALARRTAEGSGVASRLSALVEALEAHPDVRLEALGLAPGAPLAVTLDGPADAQNALAARLAAGPFEAVQQGRRLTLGAPRLPPPRPGAPDGVRAAEQRFLAARGDSAFLARTPRAVPDPAPLAAHVSGRLQEAGLAERPELRPDGAVAVAIPAVRSAVLMPLLADLEARGIRFSALSITRNPDRTLAARFVLRENVAREMPG